MMKKSKLSAGLITSFVAALALCACDVTEDAKHIVTYTDYASGGVSVNIDSYYEDYRKTESGINTIYNAVLESIIRYEFQSGKLAGKTEKDLTVLKGEANNKVKGKKEDASDAAETNHTSYDTEWDKILDSYGVEDEAELYQYFLYELEKEQVEDWYLKENYSRKTIGNRSLINEFVGVDKDGNSTTVDVAAAYPYHIRHVLASITDNATKYDNNVITEDEAKKLWDIVSGLADEDYTFSDIAVRLSGDTSSAAEGGDVGIMTTTTSFVNEFKLGIYAFDSIFTSHTKSSTAVVDGLGINTTIRGRTTTPKQEFENNIKLATVPYKAYAAINKVKKVTTDDAGFPVNDGNEHYYPRNIYWNLYCNLHQPFVITDQNLKETTFTAEEEAEFTATFSGSRFTNASNLGLTLDGNPQVLVDNEGRVVIGVRGEYGVHFMIMQKSIYDFKEGGTSVQAPSLEEYYTPYIPGDASYPKYNNGGTLVDKKGTFIDYYSTVDTSVYNARAEKVKTAIKGFDSTYDYRIYDYFLNNSQVTFKFNGVEDKNLGNQIQRLIETKKAGNLYDSANNLTNAWRSYIETIECQNASRVEAVISGEKATNQFRLIPEGCAIGFSKAEKTDARWKEGGYCYATKK